MKFIKTINHTNKMIKKHICNYIVDHDELRHRLRRMELELKCTNDLLIEMEKQNKRLLQILLKKSPEEELQVPKL